MNKLIFLFSLLSILLLSCKEDIKSNQNQQISSQQTDVSDINQKKQKQSWEGIYAYARLNQETNTYNFYHLMLVNTDSTAIYIDKNGVEHPSQILDDRESSLTITIEYDDTKKLIEINRDNELSVSEEILSYDEREILVENDYEQIYMPLEDIFKFSNHNYGTINSTNGLSMREYPSLNSEKVTTIPFNSKVSIFSSTKKYDYIELSGNEKVVGEWKRVLYEDKEGKEFQGYAFDKFISYDVDIYDLPMDRSSEDPERRYVDIYNEQQFFDNLGSMTTLNIKVEKLDLVQYIQDNIDTIDILDDFKVLNHGGVPEGIYYINEKENRILLKDYYDLEIRSDKKTEITTYPLYFASFQGVLLNNLKFKLVTDNPYAELIDIDQSYAIYFYNIDFNNDQSIGISESQEHINFIHCDFNGNTELRIYYKSSVTIDQCKFYNNKRERNLYLETLVGEDHISQLVLSNSYIGHNKELKNVIVVNRFEENPLFEITLENNTYQENKNLEEIVKEIQECC